MPLPKQNGVSRKTTKESEQILMEESMQPTPAKKPKPAVVSVTRLMIIVVVISFLVGGVSGALVNSTDLFRNFTDSIVNDSDTPNSVGTKTLKVEEESQTIDVVSKTNESVVSIIITKDLSKYYDSGSDIFQFNDNLGQLPQGKQQVGGGSGFIIGKDGIIVTNKHVVSDTDAEYTVLTNQRKSFPARVMAIDPSNDLAFVKIETEEELPVLELGDSNALQIGQTVIAIGNALGEYRNTVTKGIVSGLERTVTAGDGAGTQEILENVIQTDAAINRGNSGGPLLNLEGQIVGVNTAIDLEGQLIGFAIPSNEIKKAVESVQKYGRIVRPMLGVRYVIVTPDLARQNELPVEYGALVTRGSERNQPAIIADSPADRAGIVEDDIILEVNGKRIDQNTSLARLIQEYSPGDEVTIKFLHDEKEQTATVKLDELPAS